MAGGFPLRVEGVRILTSEALYQACRFPHLPDVQRLIIEQRSPIAAKKRVEPFRHESRPDWDQVQTKVMRWCLRMKLAQHWLRFSTLLLGTGTKPIVEESTKDGFWGAKPLNDGTLKGRNVLGCLLMELREELSVQGRESFKQIPPPEISDFTLLGSAIGAVAATSEEEHAAFDFRDAPLLTQPYRANNEH